MTSQDILTKFNLTFAELKEYAILKKHIFGSGIFKSLFVELDDNNPDHQRYESLAAKVLLLNAYLVSGRNNPDTHEISDKLIK